VKAWKVAYLARCGGSYCFGAVTGGGERYGIGPATDPDDKPGWHAYANRADTWAKWRRKLVGATGVQLEIELDSLDLDPAPGELRGRVQTVHAVYVPLKCGVVGCTAGTSEDSLFFVVGQRMVTRRCLNHGGVVTFSEVAASLGIPVRGVPIPELSI
jgi:hypothetical protein